MGNRQNQTYQTVDIGKKILFIPTKSGSTPDVEKKLHERLWFIYTVNPNCWRILKEYITNTHCRIHWNDRGIDAPGVTQLYREELDIIVRKIISTPPIKLISDIENQGNIDVTHSAKTKSILEKIFGIKLQSTKGNSMGVTVQNNPEKLRNKYTVAKLIISEIKEVSVSVGRVLEDVVGHEYNSLHLGENILKEEGTFEYHLEICNKIINFILSLECEYEKIGKLEEQYRLFLISIGVRKKKTLSPLTGIEAGTVQNNIFIMGVIEKEDRPLSIN